MTTTVASAQVQLTPSLTGFAQRLRTELQQVQRSVGDLSVSIIPKLDRSAYRAVQTDLDVLTRARTVSIHADADTRVAADDLAVLTRPRSVTVTADADTRAAADELALLTRPRSVTIDARVNGSQLSGAAGGAGGLMSTLISLAPALAPVGAWLGSVAASAGAASIAVGALGAAVAPQILQFKDLADAQKKATTAVGKYGSESKQAVAAQNAISSALDNMPPATRKAAGAFMVLKKDFGDWSDSMAKFTMVPVTQGIGILDALLPKLSPLVKSTSTQFTRLTTLLAGGINSSAFDGLMSRFSTFTSGVLQRGVDGIVHFVRVLGEGRYDGPISQFMTYAKEQGPLVRETLANIVKAVMSLLKASSEAGPGILSLVNAVAKLINALPTSFVAHIMQAYTAFKLLGLAKAGIGSLSGSLTTLSGRLAAIRLAAQNAGGGFRGLVSSMSRAQRGMIALGVLGLVAAGISKIADKAKGAPPDVDRLTTSLKALADTGKFTGELSKTFGDVNNLVADIGKLNQQADKLNKTPFGFKIPGLDDAAQWLAGKIDDMAKGRQSLSALKTDFDSLDQGLTGLVTGGHADAAAKDFDAIKAAALKSGYSVKDVTDLLPKYQSALADAAAEQRLTAQSMGLFGDQAVQVQQKLAAQKASADGLRQSLQALNDVNRSALDGMVGFESAIDAATKAAKDNGRALSMSHGQLNLGTEKARNEASALSDLAAKTDAAAAAARDNGESWSTVNGIYDKGRSKLIASAMAMGLTKQQAQQLAAQILKTPDKTARLKGNLDDLQAKLDAAKAKLNTLPPSKQTALKAEIADLEAKIARAKGDLTSLHDKTVTITYKGVTQGTLHGDGTYTSTTGFSYATGGVLPGYTPGKDVHHFYSPTAGQLNLSGGEAIMRPEWTRAVGPAFVHAMNAIARSRGTDGVRKTMGFANGGVLGRVQSFAKGGVVSLKTAQSQYDSALARVDADQRAVNAAQAAYNRALTEVANAHTAAAKRQAEAEKNRAAADLRNSRLRLKQAKQRESDAAKRLNEARKRDSSYAAAVKKRNGAVQNVLDKLANNFVKGMTGTASKISSTSNTIITALQRVRDDALTANGRKAAINAISGVRSTTAKLTSLAGRRDALKATISQATTYANDAATSAKTFAGLTGLPNGGNTFDAAGILSGLSVRLGQIKKFTSNIATLAKRGLSKSLLDQLVQAGPDGGAAYAQALVNASADQLKSINSTQASIDKAATSYGQTVANTMYDTGSQAGKGFLSGLRAQESAIEKEMTALAKRLQDAIKKALKIKSPSRVMAELGQYVGKGLVVGMESTHPEVAASAQRMADLVASADPRSVHIERDPGSAGQGRGPVHFHASVSDKPTRETVLAALSEYAVLRRPALI